MIESVTEAPDLTRTRSAERGTRNGGRAPAPLDRLPPHSPEAEQGVLGCILLSPNECMGECIGKFKGGAEVFYDLRNQTIYDECVRMYDERVPIDVITLMQRLKDERSEVGEEVSRLDLAGGVEYLASLPDAVPSAANWSYYADIVFDKYLLRRTVHVCAEVSARVYEHEGEVDELMDSVERDILAVSTARVQQNTLTTRDLVRRAIDQVEHYHQHQGMLTGVSTGFTDLDKMTTGLHGGEMVVIAARPSMGKTSLAMNIAEHAAVNEKLPTGVFSLEMTADALMLRMLCSRARVNLRNVREGFLAERDFPKLTATAVLLQGAPLYIDDSSGLSILQLRAKARRMAQQYGIKLFVIDYLQLLHSTSRRADNRQQEIADISSGIKALAKELDVPVIVLAQLNRELEKDPHRKPRMSDLRESGAIEQDADLIGLLYKPHTGEESEDGGPMTEDRDEVVPVNLLVAKQRNGPTGDVRLTFIKSLTRFESAARVSDEDVNH